MITSVNVGKRMWFCVNMVCEAIPVFLTSFVFATQNNIHYYLLGEKEKPDQESLGSLHS